MKFQTTDPRSAHPRSAIQCTRCGVELRPGPGASPYRPDAEFLCPGCAISPLAETMFCGKCGAPIYTGPDASLGANLGADIRCPHCVPEFVRAAIAALPGARAGEAKSPVPHSAARELAAKYGKDVVLIFGWDQKSGQMQCTCHGRTAEWHVPADRCGQILCELMEAALSMTDLSPKPGRTQR